MVILGMKMKWACLMELNMYVTYSVIQTLTKDDDDDVDFVTACDDAMQVEIERISVSEKQGLYYKGTNTRKYTHGHR